LILSNNSPNPFYRYIRKPLVRNDLSVEAKQTFQVVAFLATILVVGIHYKSAVPELPDPSAASWNELAQEFLFGGIARVAVPLFAFAAGFFYFRSDDGSLATYRTKLQQRTRTLLFPYFIVGSLALVSWLAVRSIEGEPVSMTMAEFFTTWLLHPPAEQLWFLRDLMVLILLAPVIRFSCHSRLRHGFVGVIASLWTFNYQVFPQVAGWHLLHMETLLFFTLGCLAVSRMTWIQSIGRLPVTSLLGVWLIWADLIVLRIIRRADFDIWYANAYGWNDLLLHQLSVLVGCFALFMTAWRIRCKLLIRLSGASFFVYLVHEFPLRAAVGRLADQVLDHSISCWIVTPLVLLGCYTAGVVLTRVCPSLMAVLTGGRTPATAAEIANSHPTTPTTGVPATS
jgi:surface polysaccharide O-acyltransferase-like enzyme